MKRCCGCAGNPTSRARRWLCAYPVVSDLDLYRPYHLKHHRFTQQSEDPDLGLSAPFPITKRSLLRKLVRDLTGQTAYTRPSSSSVMPGGRPD